MSINEPCKYSYYIDNHYMCIIKGIPCKFGIPEPDECFIKEKYDKRSKQNDCRNDRQ